MAKNCYTYLNYINTRTLLGTHHEFITGMKTADYIANPQNDT